MKLDRITARGSEYLYRHPDSGVIYFRRYTTETGEITKSLYTKDLAEAKRERDKLMKQRLVAATQAAMRKTAMEKYDQFISRKRDLNKSPSTITSMLASRNFFAKFMGGMMPEDLTSEWWDREFIPQTKYLRFRAERNSDGTYTRIEVKRKTPRKFFNDRKWLIGFLEQCLEDGVVQRVPKFADPDPERDPGKVYTDEEVENLINFAQTPDLRLALLMAVTMGMRRGEVFGLKSDRVDVKNRVIRLRAQDTKIRRPRSFAMSPVTADEIIRRAEAGTWIFPSKDDPSRPVHKDSYTNAWRTLKKVTGIEGRFHFLRHTFLTKAFRTPGANAALICHYAGLSLEMAQRVYLHFDDNDSRQVAVLVSYGQ